MERLTQDLRYAARMLFKHPGFTFLAVVTLALGIGANGAVFTLINSLLLRPIMAREPDQLVGIFQQEVGKPHDFRFASYPEFQDLQANKDVFEEVLAFNLSSVGVWQDGLVHEVRADFVSPNFFSALGVAPILGRTFVSEEGDSHMPVAVLSHSYWRRLGGDPNIIGTKLKLTSGDYTVVGVMPKGFTGTTLSMPAMFLPVGVMEGIQSQAGNSPVRIINNRDRRSFMLVGRMKPELNLGNIKAPLEVLSNLLNPPGRTDEGKWSLFCTTPSRFGFSNRPSQTGRVMGQLAALASGLSLTVLLVACLNLANMMLARGASRRKEIAVRLAVGAGRIRILRQLLTEGLLLAFFGGVAGLLVAAWLMAGLGSFANAGLGKESIYFDASPDWRVLAVSSGLCLLATLFFALGPAWKLSRSDVNADLKEQVSDDVGTRRFGVFGLRNVLAVGQLAFSLALLVAAALFTRSAIQALHTDPGFQFGSHFYAEVNGELARYDDVRARQVFSRVTEQLAVLPGVESVSLGMFVPLKGERWDRGVQIGGAPAPSDKASSFADGRSTMVTYNVVGADYFRTLGVRLLSGREFNRSEVESTNSPKVAIISQNLAEKLWPGEDAIGREIQFPSYEKGKEPDLMRVVGVVTSIQWELFDKDESAFVFRPFGQDFRTKANIHVRVAPGINPGPLIAQVRAELQRLDPLLPVTELKTMRATHQEGMAVRIVRVGAMLFGAFGAVAMLLSFVGVYGLKSYSVARRTREIGIRMALGADAGGVISMILRESARLAAVGLGIGLLLSMAVGKLTNSFLVGVAPFDVPAFVVAFVVLGFVTLIACLIPARRAAKVEPMVALRHD